jgi:hypothetical protein
MQPIRKLPGIIYKSLRRSGGKKYPHAILSLIQPATAGGWQERRMLSGAEARY